MQPWRVRILSDDRADLLIERRRTLPKEDPTGSFIILTMGLFIEALGILAANRSFKLDYELYQAPSQFTPEHIANAEGALLPFAQLSLTREEAGESPAVPVSSGQHRPGGYQPAKRATGIASCGRRVTHPAVNPLSDCRAGRWPGTCHLRVGVRPRNPEPRPTPKKAPHRQARLVHDAVALPGAHNQTPPRRC